jgi:hypothetical protein
MDEAFVPGAERRSRTADTVVFSYSLADAVPPDTGVRAKSPQLSAVR